MNGEYTFVTDFTQIWGDGHTDEYFLKVTGTYSKGYNAITNGDYPEPGEPDSFDISSVKACRSKYEPVIRRHLEDGPWFEVPNEMITLEALEHLQQICIQNVKDDVSEARESTAEFHRAYNAVNLINF